MRTAALLGAGVMQCPTYVVGEDIEAGRLVPILTKYSVPEFSAYAVHAQGQHAPAKLRGFIDLLAARFGANPPWDRWQLHAEQSV
ncbi:MAG: LysR substrate-binding domain-containing protein [Bradyrhizobium sp.]